MHLTLHGRELMEHREGTAGEQRFDLARFDLSDMIECGRAVRAVAENAGSMERAAQAIVGMLYERLADAGGTRNCALVRCFKTHRFGQLPEDLAEIARGGMSGREPDGQMPCLTLLATAGDEVAWGDRRSSRGHAAIPLESVEIIERAPMISALLRQMGLEIGAAMYPNLQLILDAEQRAFNVFHVEYAEGSALIPGQDAFVKPHGIKSVLGFGGLMPSGELFAVIMFSRTRIPRETADLFRTIALGVKLALLPWSRGPIFEGAVEDRGTFATGSRAGGRDGPLGETEEEQLRSEISTLRLLIPALEEAALHQTRRLKTAYDELKSQGEQVREQGVRLSAMLEATTDAVFLLDAHWRFTFLNGHAQELIAGGRELLGQTMWEAFPEAEGRAFARQYRRVIEEKVSVEFQEFYPEPLNKWFEVHAFPSDGGLAAFFRDITDRLKTEATLRQTEKLAATGRMAASIAHEINNPLEAVTNLLYLLGTDDTLTGAAKGYVAEAESELQRVSEITTHMLRFHRQSTSATEVDACEILESVLVLFGGRLRRAGIYVEKRFVARPSFMGFAGELRQVFANLVGNALDASRDGGRLLLRVRDAHDPVTGVAGVRVTVADTGGGMSREVVAKIFEPFFTTKGITGTGLGLWVSLELVKKQGGAMRVRSSAGAEKHGTVFGMFFPLAMREG